MNQFHVTVFSGTAYTVEKRNVYRSEILAVPEGSVLLHSEVVLDGDTEVLEVWIGVPNDAHDAAPEVVRPTTSLPLEPAREVVLKTTPPPPPPPLEEDFEDEGFEENDEYYADY